MTVITEDELTKELVETSFTKEESEATQSVREINQVTSSHRADKVLELLALQQGRLTTEQLRLLEQLIRQNADIFGVCVCTYI